MEKKIYKFKVFIYGTEHIYIFLSFKHALYIRT
jgi:hypothetical protein